MWALAAAGLVIAASLALFALGPDEANVPRLPTGGETGAILDPLLFRGAAQVAYTVARNDPELMDRIYCFCECSRPPLLHKSLRTCFATRHGAG